MTGWIVPVPRNGLLDAVAHDLCTVDEQRTGASLADAAAVAAEWDHSRDVVSAPRRTRDLYSPVLPALHPFLK
jgi:hypothetical protein